MRQWLLENVTFGLEEVFNQACTLEAAARNAESYRPTSQSSAVKVLQPKREEDLPDYAATLTEKYFFCGNKKHPRSRCPAQGVDCYKCQKKGILLKCVEASHPPLSKCRNHVKHQTYREHRTLHLRC